MRTSPSPHLGPTAPPPDALFPVLLGLVEEARLGARVASRPRRLHPQQHRIKVAVKTNLEHLHRAARRFTLPPQPSLARVEPRLAALARARPRLLVHTGTHQRLAGLRVLYDSAHE